MGKAKRFIIVHQVALRPFAYDKDGVLLGGYQYRELIKQESSPYVAHAVVVAFSSSRLENGPMEARRDHLSIDPWSP